MYAVIATGGKQYRVQKDDVIDIERVNGDVGGKVTFDEVLLVGEGAKIELGSPLLKSAKVSAEIVDQYRGKKLTVFKMKRRKGYRRKHGHRQELTKVKISTISGGSKAKKEEAPKKAEPKAEKKAPKKAVTKKTEAKVAPKKTEAKKAPKKAPKKTAAKKETKK